MKQFSEDFLLIYKNEASPSLVAKHQTRLSLDPNYYNLWALFYKRFDSPEIQRATMPADKVEAVLQSLNATESRV